MSRSNFSISIHWARSHDAKDRKNERNKKKCARQHEIILTHYFCGVFDCCSYVFIVAVAVAVSLAYSCCSTSLFGWPLYFVFRIPKLETMFDHYRVFSIHSGWAELVYLQQTLYKYIVYISRSWTEEDSICINMHFMDCVLTQNTSNIMGDRVVVVFVSYRFNHKSLYLSSREQWHTAILAEQILSFIIMHANANARAYIFRNRAC